MTKKQAFKAADLTADDQKNLVDFFSVLLESHQEEREAKQQLVNVLDLYVMQLKKM